ncbi:hypothetical protein [Geobacter sp. AOG2]|uniref:hypothetical protein n=1 Tax=Geobacter sp. AOG2 TaxID=1566347 RepID=UPI001CC505AD|nr:hypothetical protein [Geobacter sp. AOG2]GFE62778.1 hypothetical protein AOG2_33660 [Geobacter sp. AOG2]
MKVYLFDTNSGLYEGEDFWDPGDVGEEEGVTSLAPPVAHEGHLPVYDRTDHNWKLVPIDSLKKSVARND